MSFRSQHTRPAVAVHGDVQRQVWQGGSRECSGRDASVLLMLQRDCMVSMPAIRASQPSPTRALVHSQQVALTRAQDAAAELELSCDPSTTQLEAAEHQARWAAAMQRGKRSRRSGRGRRPHRAFLHIFTRKRVAEVTRHTYFRAQCTAVFAPVSTHT